MATHRIQVRDLVNRILKCTGDYFGSDYSEGRTWTRAQVIIAFNQALLEWAYRTAFLRELDTVELSDGTKTYDLPDDCLHPLRIGFYDDNACTWVSTPTTITLQDIAYRPITGDATPLEHFTEYLEYSKFGYQPTVGEDITAYILYVREPEYVTEEAWTLTDDDISFDEGTKEIRSASSAIDTDAFPADATVTVSGTAHNDGVFTVVSSTTSKIVVSEAVTDEAAGSDFTLTSSVTGLNYLEDGIPTWFQKDIKWGPSVILLSELKDDPRKAKIPYCKRKWDGKIDFMKKLKDFHGHDYGIVPL